jgi:hypothetical protein
MPRRDKWKTVVPVLFVFWLAFWLYRTRYAMLDDALIHLRYADNLHQLHMFSYDGLHPNFGASSLAYVGLLSLLRGITTGPLLAKITSVIAYLTLIVTVAVFALRLRAALVTRALAYGMLLCLLSPMAIRWLTDGMETGLVILAVLVLAWLADREVHSPALSVSRALLMVAAGFLFVLLRIESLSLIALVSVMIFLGRENATAADGSHPSPLPAALRCLPLPLGALLAALLVRVYFGTLLPDTAIAKTGAPSLGIAHAGLQVIASSFVLGIGTLLLWLLSAVCSWRAYRISRTTGTPPGLYVWVSLIANVYFPLVLSLACIRGQRIEGVRHVLWIFEFSLAWNILQLARWDRSHEDVQLMRKPFVRKAVYAVAIFLALLLPVDWVFAQRVMDERAQLFLKMQDSDFHLFQDKVVVAADIGFIGYFTGGEVCDLHGLVNGRAAAQATPDQRSQSCAQKHPAALFLSGSQMQVLGRYLDLHGWTPCQAYDFANVRTLDRHYLLVPAADGPAQCAYFGGPISAGF